MSKVRQVEDSESLSDYAASKVTTMGHITEVVSMKKKSLGSPCKKVSKDLYCDMRTGFVYEYEHYESRADDLNSIRQTLARVRALINTNVTVPENVRWVTLTYAENMTDTKRLMTDYEKFWKRFCYWCKREGHGKPEYITVQEPQGRGAWHVHAFFIWPHKAPFVPNDTMRELWSHGFTKTKATQNCDNVGAYFSAYLADLPLDELEKLPKDEKTKALAGSVSFEEKQFIDEQGLVKEKKFVKGGRLYLYPPGMNIVRTTRGVKQPEVEYMSRKEAQKKVSEATETFSRTYEIVDDGGTVVNVISKAYYNSIRKE